MREPLYATIAGRAEARIRAGEWAPGDRLPPERELCRDLNVSRATLRQALAELEQRGLVSRHQGRGTFVTRPRVPADLAGFFSYGEALRARGMQLTTRVRSAEVVEAGRAIAAELGILPGDPVVHLERVRAVQSEALILESSHLPAVRFPDLETRDLAARSLYQVLREDYDCHVETAVESLEPVILTPRRGAPAGRSPQRAGADDPARHERHDRAPRGAHAGPAARRPDPAPPGAAGPRPPPPTRTRRGRPARLGRRSGPSTAG